MSGPVTSTVWTRPRCSNSQRSIVPRARRETSEDACLALMRETFAVAPNG
ncbi:MAG TPA: hypothetical protein VMR06_02375 [Dokdonella sp.]|nr:hypothetical protein [Dokdonella sp.]HUD40822.1 hypothetical protein [Dokdonella sp.]